MRPTYETPKDSQREHSVAQRVAETYGFGLKKNEKFACTDYQLSRKDHALVHLEVKCRNINWGDYPTIILSALKYAKGMKMVGKGEVFLLVVETRDALMLHNAQPDRLPVLQNTWMGRQDRGDSMDMEWVVQIPISEFAQVQQSQT